METRGMFAGVQIWGWDSVTSAWVKILVNAAGKLIIDPSEILENTPTDGQVAKAPTSNWAYDHAASAHPTVIRKTADETVNNSALLQNDDHLFKALAANEVWYFEFILIHIGNTTANFKAAVTVPNGATIIWHAIGNNAAGAIAEDVNVTSGASAILDGAATNRLVVLRGTVINGATAGNLQLQWAQGTATVVDTKVLTNSCLILHKVA